MNNEEKYQSTDLGKIPKDWQISNLSDICEKLIDCSHARKPEFINNSEYIFIEVDNIGKNGYLDFHKKRFISKHDYINWTKRLKPQENDIIITKTGRVGASAIIHDRNNYCIGRNQVILRSDNLKVLPHYLWHYLQSEYFKKSVKTLTTTGTILESLHVKNISKLRIIYPCIREQAYIIDVLDNISSKIELLQEQNKTLEAIGQAIFKHWFIDFEFPCLPENYKPINNDEFSGACKLDEMKSVCTYKSVGGMPIPEKGKYFVYVLLCNDGSFYIGQTQDIYRRWYEHKTGKGAKWTKANEPIKIIHYEEYATRTDAVKREKELKTGFGRKWLKQEYEKLTKSVASSPAPMSILRQAGKMVDSDLGYIPQAWNVERIGNKMNTVLGGTPSRSKKEFWEKGSIAWINSGKVNEFRITQPSEYITEDAMEQSATKLLPPRTVVFAITGATLGQISILEIESCANQSVVGIIENDYLRSSYIFFMFKEIAAHIVGHKTGGAQQHVNKNDINKTKFIMPHKNILNKYYGIINPLMNKISNNCFYINSLKDVRDLLLPKLMSGQIRVPLGE